MNHRKAQLTQNLFHGNTKNEKENKEKWRIKTA
jgi:hypothetical protein